MFIEFLRFELVARLRQPLVYVFFLVTFGLTFTAMLWSNFQLGENLENLHVNAPYAILNRVGYMGLLCLLFVTAIMAGAATRDTDSGFGQVLYAAPLDKAGYLWGRFVGSTLVASGAMMGVLVAILLGTPLNDPDQVGAFQLVPYLQAVSLFIVPNVLLVGALVYCVTVLTRRSVYAFITALVLLLGYLVVSEWTRDQETPARVVLLDPFGINTLRLLTKYWTVAEKNTLVLPAAGLLLTNRLLWLGVAGTLVALTHGAFSFSASTKGRDKRQPVEIAASPSVTVGLPRVRAQHTAWAQAVQFTEQAKLELCNVLKGIPFLLLLGLGLLNLLNSAAEANTWLGGHTYPVTYIMLEAMTGSYSVFVIAILVYYGGALVWQEQDAHLDEILDASPRPSWAPYTAKMLALFVLTFVLLALGVLVCVAVQAAQGYTRFEWGVYGGAVFGIELTRYAMLAVGTVFLHVLLRNRYLAYLLTILLVVIQPLSNQAWGWEHNLYLFADTPSYTYSAMNGFGPFVTGIVWFKLYWTAFALLLAALSAGLWQRGKAPSRLAWHPAQLRQSFTPPLRGLAAMSLLAWLGLGAWIFYNTNVRNQYQTRDTSNTRQATYEKRYKRYEYVVQPRLTAVNLHVDLHPETRAVHVRGVLTLTNKTARPLDTLLLTHADYLQRWRFNVPGGQAVLADSVCGFHAYRLATALAPGDSLVLRYAAQYQAQGFENRVSRELINDNGIFLNNGELAPTVGYARDKELESKKKRADFGLPPRQRLPEPSDLRARAHNVIAPDADRIRFEATVGTSPDQLAVAPGELQQEWMQGGRRYFHYRLEAPVLNIYAIVSARYAVRRARWNNVNLEVYYQPGHEYNLDRMQLALRQSLAYYSQQLGPYPLREARIIEFPRYQEFAEAFPGTMPYSEAIGFITQLGADDRRLDNVFRVVAHEMAHQWWAHQVVGSPVKGVAFMAESMADYFATVLLERQYGAKPVLRVRKYDLDKYLRGRGRETIREESLLRCETQPYIYYEKGAFVLYSLRAYLGEQRLHGALAQFIADYKGKGAPYPVADDLYAYLQRATPDSLQYLLDDQLRRITLYDNQVKEVAYKPLPDGRYRVLLQLESHKYYADSLGKETEAPLRDYVDVAVYGTKEQVLYRQRLHLTNNRQEVQLTVPAVPASATIDPDLLLIDRKTDDNTKPAIRIGGER
ncbi:ABC transporter permease/M1 family aminopeptidase [Hymenobacter terrenus]|uniref:ABC transporter permease/M1 family aminopeptidase n=1 Tax=Hymenobacter terrenus TaxID=1629124 RepID=UPI000619EACE|nr:M1 family aminopeptidase [Hymenobacter terrenus]